MKLAREILDALEASFHGRMLDPIQVDSSLIRAPLLCQPVTTAFPGSRAAIEYGRLARFLTLPDAERDQWMGLRLDERRALFEDGATTPAVDPEPVEEEAPEGLSAAG